MEARLWTLPFCLTAAANLLHGTSFHTFVHLPGFLRSRGLEEHTIGWWMALLSGVAILVRPWIARTIDVRGRRVVLLAGGAIHVFACLTYLLAAHGAEWILLARVVHGFSHAALFSVMFTVAADVIPAQRLTQGMALFGISGMVSLSIGSTLGDFVLRHGDYFDLLWSAAGFATLGWLVCLPLRDSHSSPGQKVVAPRPFRVSARQTDLLPIWFLGTVYAFSMAACFVFLKTYVIEIGTGSAGGFFSAYATGAIALRFGGGWIPDRWGRRKMLVPAFCATVAGLGVLGFWPQASAILLAGLLCGLGHGFIFPILLSLVRIRARDGEQGAGMALFTALFDIGALLGSPTLGLVVSRAGYPAMFSVAALSTALALVTFLWWDRNHRVDTPSENQASA